MRSILAATLALCACADSSALVTEGKADESGSTEKAERWASNDDPATFGASLTRVPSQLPATGAAQTSPWAGSYWPTYLDNVNAQWAGPSSDSAALKYQKAFGGSNVEDAVSAFRGIDSATSQKTCTQTSECDATNNETCAMRRGKTTGRCIPTWWGICHAWSPAAIMLPEPKHAVTRNGVTFEVPDLKALGSLVFDGASAEFVSSRCNLVDGKIALDPYGRPSNANPECRDTNPGTMHLLLTNYLGLKHQAFVEDRVADAQVWNQPLRGYRVTQQQTITAQQANQLIGATSVGGTTTHSSGTVAQGAWAGATSFPVMAGTHVKVQMTGDGDADLYVRFGAAPDLQTYDCRPYVNGTGESCDLDTPAGVTQVFLSVNGYAATSNFQLDVTIGGSVPTSYVFNTDAKGFLQVTTEVDYIGESEASQGYIGSGIGAYTQTDRYTYVLELDASGNIIGGEWTGDSKLAHPDFLWLPLGPGQATVANGAISYANVKSLIDESVSVPGTGGGTGGGAGGGGGSTGGGTGGGSGSGGGTGGGSNTGGGSGGGTADAGTPMDITGTVTQNQFQMFGPYNVPAGSTLVVKMTGTGDADLYAKKGLAPTLSSYDCRPYVTGSTESCQIAGPGPVYVGVNGYAASSNFTLKLTFQAAAPPPPMNGGSSLNTTGTVSQGQLKVFTLAVTAGTTMKVTTTSANDVDLYLQMDVAPTLSTYWKRAYTSSGNETLNVTIPSNGTLYIGVNGYQAASFTLNAAPTP